MLKHSVAELSACPKAASLENPATHWRIADNREPPRHRSCRGAGAQRAGPGGGDARAGGGGSPASTGSRCGEGGGRRRSSAAGPEVPRRVPGWASGRGRRARAGSARPPPLSRRGGAAIGPRAGRARADGARGRPADRRGPALPSAGGKRAAPRLAGARCQSGRPRPRAAGCSACGGRGSAVLPPFWAWSGISVMLRCSAVAVGVLFHRTGTPRLPGLLFRAQRSSALTRPLWRETNPLPGISSAGPSSRPGSATPAGPNWRKPLMHAYEDSSWFSFVSTTAHMLPARAVLFGVCVKTRHV